MYAHRMPCDAIIAGVCVCVCGRSPNEPLAWTAAWLKTVHIRHHAFENMFDSFALWLIAKSVICPGILDLSRLVSGPPELVDTRCRPMDTRWNRNTPATETPPQIGSK